MDEEQVRVVLGEPVRRTRFTRRRTIEVWIYPGYTLHQDQMRGHGAQLFRLVFIEGALAIIEPI